MVATTMQNAGLEMGIFEGMSYEAYDAIPAYRRTLLMAGINNSLAHLKYEKDHPEGEPSEALLFGQALHAATLEPDRFEREVVLGAINPKTGEPYGADTKAQAEFRAANPGKIVMAKGDRERLIGMGAAIRAHPTAGKLIRATARAELTLVWRDHATGIPCKARLDSFIGGGLGTLDLKSTKCAAPGAFSRSLFDYGYDVQAAMVVDGLEAVGIKDGPFTIVAAEKEPPYAVAVYTIGPDSIAVGRARYREVLHQIVQAERTGVWPGYPEDAVQIDIPEWVFKRFHNGD